MTNDEYDKVELPALNQLQALGWKHQHGLQLVGAIKSKQSHAFRFVDDRNL